MNRRFIVAVVVMVISNLYLRFKDPDEAFSLFYLKAISINVIIMGIYYLSQIP